MPAVSYVLFGVLALLVLFLAVILIRALTFRAKKEERPAPAPAPVTFDADAAVHSLAELVTCRTVSRYDHALEDDAEFEKLLAKLPVLFPNVTAACELRRFDGRALLYRWKGKNPAGEPAVLMAHYDVVPVDESGWTHPAFEGVIEDGVLWGRGTLDTKVTFNAALSAAENLIRQGFVPENDVYFAFSGGEEVNGPGAREIVKYFREQGLTPSLVVDEGGAVVRDVFPGVKEPCGLIGIAEKGMMNLELSVRSAGGHASAPKPHSPLPELADACQKIESHPFPFHLTKPVREMFDTLGRRSSFLYRIIFANLWCFGGLLNALCKKSGGELNALVRTTVAFTQAAGSDAPNVIPPEAKLTANLRLNPEDTVDSALARIRKTVKNSAVTYAKNSDENPSRISRTDVVGWTRVASAVSETWEGCVVSPYLMVQCSDSRHWGAVSDRVYRFSAMDLTSEERRTIHGNDEHIRLSAIHRSVEFYIRLIRQC